MGCDHIRGKGPNGEAVDVFICSRGSRQKACEVTGCRDRSSKLCDFPLGGKKAGKTCDRAICDGHAHRVDEVERVEGGMRIRDTIDYCPTHFAMQAAQVSRKAGEP